MPEPLIIENLPTVDNSDIPSLGEDTITNPEQTMADITRKEWEDFYRNYGQYELDLIGDITTTTEDLVKKARTTSKRQSKQARETLERNRARYGIGSSPVQDLERERALQRESTLGQVGAANRAQLEGRAIESAGIADLMNIRQGMYQNTLGQMSAAANNIMSLNRAYRDAKRASKAQGISNIIGLGATAATFIV